jgi:hypothetical protein
MARRRTSLSQPQLAPEVFQAFKRLTREAIDEADVANKGFAMIEGHSNILYSQQRLLGNLAPLTDGSIVDAQPDFYHGAPLHHLNQRVGDALDTYIIPCKYSRAPIVPNHFIELKGKKGTLYVMDLQVCYDGALGARAMQQLQSYGQPALVYDHHAYTIVSTFDGQHLHSYSVHTTSPTRPGCKPKYHVHELGAFALTHNAEGFRQGIGAYRNLRDWAHEKRNEFIEAANQRAATLVDNPAPTSSTHSDTEVESERAAAGQTAEEEWTKGMKCEEEDARRPCNII